MQNFNDSWSVILDDKCKPLVGKIGFYEPNTTELKNIFGTDEETPLQNPIYCNGVTTNQVLLEEGDYTVRYWRYIGNGNMETDPNEDSWFLYKTELIKDGSVVNSDIENNGIVDTIDDLKDLVGMEDGDLVLVNGYYTKDDCPARYFVWHENSSDDDDGGVCIQANGQNTGRWIMKIPGTYIDVRWFGDMPGGSISDHTSNLGQRAKASAAANKYKKDLYFPSYTKGTSNGFYEFNGSNTVSVDQNIICDSGVRFVVKNGTSGSKISCSEFIKEGRYLFVSEVGKAIGGYELNCDWIKTSWLHASTTDPENWADQGFIVDEMNGPIHFKNTKVKIETAPCDGTQFTNCQITECNKLISGDIAMHDMEIDTDWFDDDYDWGELTLTGCRIYLQNCKDANTYIILKNKQHDGNYGDLGEQTISAVVIPDCVIENCTGSISLAGHGNIELHNVNLTITGLNGDTINAIDSWLTINQNVTLNYIQIRRGSLAGTGTITLSNASSLDNVNIEISVTTNAALDVRNSTIKAPFICKNVILEHNEIFNLVTQTEVDGVINVHCCRNNFTTDGVNKGKHYIFANEADTLVHGEWVGNSCTYDDSHWIRINRTNLVAADYLHDYSYIGNEEPYLDKWSGGNMCMKLSMYRGYKGTGTGILNTNIPILFWNEKTNFIYAVNRGLHWKMFTVGRASTRRQCSIMTNTYNDAVGSNFEGNDKSRMTPILWNWGQIIGDGGILNASCLDGTGEAEFKWSFESATADHSGSYSYGSMVGILTSEVDYINNWVRYPDTPNKRQIRVNVVKDFKGSSTVIVQE